MISKPILEWSRNELEEKFSEMGYKPRFIRKPVTLENLMGKDMGCSSVGELIPDSRERIHKYLDEVDADGAIVLDIQQYGKKDLHITIAPYKLIRLKDSE